MAGNLPVVPSRASLSASGRAPAASTVRKSGAQRFFGSARGTMARPVSFQQQTASLRQSMQQSHVGAIPAGGRSNAAFAARGNSNMRPSAGVPASRQMNNFNNRAGTNRAGTSQPGMNQPGMRNDNRGNTRSFNPPSSRSSAPSSMGAQQRGTMQNTPAENRGGFRPFNPPTNRSSAPTSMGAQQRGTMQNAPAENRGGFRPFTPPSNRSSGPSSMAAPQRGTMQSPPAENRSPRRCICRSTRERKALKPHYKNSSTWLCK